MTETKVRQNYWAILVAAVACFLLEGVWYTIFQQPWLDGTGRTKEWLMDPTNNKPLLQYGTALIGTAAMAFAISCVTQLTGAQTALRGIKAGILLWLGFVLTTWATEYAFEVRPLSLLAINTGVWLFGMALMGGIVGGWRKK
jgi:hypothetical protein